MKNHKSLLIAFIFILSSCRPPPSPVTSPISNLQTGRPSIGITPSPSILSTGTDAMVATQKPERTRTFPLNDDDLVTATPRPTDTPTPTITPLCPTIDPALSFGLPDNLDQIEESIRTYLSAGGDPAKLQALTGMGSEHPISSLAITDLDGDSIPEIAVTTSIFAESAKISVFRCGLHEYLLAYSDSFFNSDYADILFTDRIFARNPRYLIIRAFSIAGWNQYFIGVGWNGNNWQSIELGQGAFADIALYDQDNDGIKEVFIQDNFSRPIIDTYKWDGSQYDSINLDWIPGNDRVYYLQDAERAMEEGNPLLAIANYEIAATRENLTSSATYDEIMQDNYSLSEPYQRSYAYFRIVALWLYLGRPDEAAKYLQDMVDEFPSGSPGYEFVRAAQEMVSWYGKSPKYLAACSTAVALLDKYYPGIVLEHIGSWPHSGPVLSSTEDICKF